MHKRLIAVVMMLVFAMTAMAGVAMASEAKDFKKYPAVVDYKFVAKYAKMPKPKDVMIIDSRPFKPKYVEGYIPTAVSIPTSQFDKMVDQLPANKDALLIFYCGGFKCPLSHKAAFKAEALGYTNVKVYAAGFPDFKKQHPYYSIAIETLKDMMGKGEKYVAVDARPYKKYLEGSIPGALGIPEKEFADKRDMLPVGKADTKLVYFCGGYKCALSHKSAVKARYLGYKNVVVAEAGYPAWKEMYGAGSAMEVKAGAAEGAVDTEWFLATLKSNPDSLTLIDVRDAEEFAGGHFPTAINMTAEQIEKNIDSIPMDKPIVFSCASGARAGEAYYIFMDMKPNAKNVYYLEATNEFGADNTYEVHPNK